MKSPLWICVDEHFCTEFGITIEQCVERYRESIDEDVDINTLTFYSLTEPYIIDKLMYTIKEKKPTKS